MKTIRDQWFDKEITDIDYIQHLEKENEKLKTKSYCETCKFFNQHFNIHGEASDVGLCDSPEQQTPYGTVKTFGCLYHEKRD